NEDMPLANISRPDIDSSPATLKWLKATSIIHGVPYNLPRRNVYSAETSIERYGDLLRRCGSLMVRGVKAKMSEESVESHADNLIKSIREMILTSDNLCDLKIIVGGRDILVHRVVMCAVSSYFRGLTCGQWKETSSSVLNLDNIGKEGEEFYGTPG